MLKRTAKFVARHAIGSLVEGDPKTMFLGKLFKALRPKNAVASIVDAVIDRINDRYEIVVDASELFSSGQLKINLEEARDGAPKIDIDTFAGDGS